MRCGLGVIPVKSSGAKVFRLSRVLWYVRLLMRRCLSLRRPLLTFRHLSLASQMEHPVPVGRRRHGEKRALFCTWSGDTHRTARYDHYTLVLCLISADEAHLFCFSFEKFPRFLFVGKKSAAFPPSCRKYRHLSARFISRFEWNLRKEKKGMLTRKPFWPTCRFKLRESWVRKDFIGRCLRAVAVLRPDEERNPATALNHFTVLCTHRASINPSMSGESIAAGECETAPKESRLLQKCQHPNCR